MFKKIKRLINTSFLIGTAVGLAACGGDSVGVDGSAPAGSGLSASQSAVLRASGLSCDGERVWLVVPETATERAILVSEMQGDPVALMNNPPCISAWQYQEGVCAEAVPLPDSATVTVVGSAVEITGVGGDIDGTHEATTITTVDQLRGMDSC